MKITVHFHGILADWVGMARAELDFPPGATLTDLLARIREDYGGNLPPPLKEKGQEAFQQAFWAVRGTTPVSDLHTVLKDGEEWRFFFPLAGG